MVTIDDMDGSYDDYVVDATSLSGLRRKSLASTTLSSQSSSIDMTILSASVPTEQSTPSPSTSAQQNTIRMEEAEWFCVLANQSFGPVNRLQFANMARFGIVDANTLVWKSGMPQWALASTVAKLYNSI
jgi:hypothetical protein